MTTQITTYIATATVLDANGARVNANCWKDNAWEFATTDRAALDAEIDEAREYAGESLEIDVREETEDVDLVVVEVMPAHLRASHEAAGNSGSYPANGSRRYLVERGEIVEDEWTSIVRDATTADLDRYTMDREGRQVATA